MGAAHKCLHLTMLSAQGLKDVCTFGTMSPYAKAWIHPSAKQRTAVATNAGCTPVWGHKIHLSLPSNALIEEKLSLTIQIWNQGSASDTLVGSANLPLCDLLNSTKPNGLEFMACQLMRPSGRVQGLVNFSIEISDSNVSLPACISSKESHENSKETSSSSTISEVQTTKADFINDQIYHNSSMELKESMKRLVLQSEKPVGAAPDSLGTGHGLSTSSDPQGINKQGIPVTRFSSAPDALDLPHRDSHGEAHSQGDGVSHGDVHSSSNGGGAAQGPQNSLPGVGGMMLGGVIGALLMGESVNVRNDGSDIHLGCGQGLGGSSEGVPQP
ncbi:unnamed protein product [Calypogeia fissa]